MRMFCVLATALVAVSPAAAKEMLSPADAARQVCVATRDATGQRDGQFVCKTGREWQQALAAHAEPEIEPQGRIVFLQPKRVNGRWQF